jgi:hypothetical protein
MKFLCLAYGEEKAWRALTKEQQAKLLAQDEVLRKRGATMGILEAATTVQTWREEAPTRPGSFAIAEAPLVGFSLVEAKDLEEAIRLVAYTPCAVAKGAIEVWPIREADAS